MKTRARRRNLLAWLPRGALIATAVLAPVIDGGVERAAAAGDARVEVVESVGPDHQRSPDGSLHRSEKNDA